MHGAEKHEQHSIQDVAKLAGVSLGTVSNVLNHPNRVRASTLEKVRVAIGQLGYVRNDAARQLKAGKSKVVGLLVLDFANPFFSALIRGAENTAVKRGYQVIVGSSGSSEAREKSYLKMFQEQRLSGVLLSPTGNMVKAVGRLRAMNILSVIVDAKSYDNLSCSVSVDDVFGGRLAVAHLIELGKTRIAFVGGSIKITQVADRYLGAKQSVDESPGVSLDRWEAKSMEFASGREVGFEILKLVPDARPDAIFAANDLLAAGIMQAFSSRNSSITPEEIAIVGFDDSFAQIATLPLTSIRQPPELMGEMAIQLLLDEVENPKTHHHRQVVFQPELVIRESTIGRTEVV